MSDSKQAAVSINPAISSRLISLTQTINAKRNAILSNHSLLPGQDDFLFALLATDGIAMGRLAETLGMTASSTTKMAIKLEALDLVRREASRVDSRQNFAHLTSKGTAVARALVADYEKQDTKLFSKLSDKGFQRLIKLLDRLDRANKGAGKKPKKAGGKKKKSKKTKKSK